MATTITSNPVDMIINPKQMQDALQGTMLDAAAIAPIINTAINSTTNTAIANTQNIESQSFTANSMVSQSSGYIGGSQYNLSSMASEANFDALLSQATDKKVQASQMLVDAKLQNQAMIADTGIKYASMYQKNAQQNAKNELSAAELQLSYDQFGLSQEQFAWQKQMEREEMDLKKAEFEETVRMDEFNQSMAERQQAEQEWVNQQELELQQQKLAQKEAKEAEKIVGYSSWLDQALTGEGTLGDILNGKQATTNKNNGVINPVDAEGDYSENSVIWQQTNEKGETTYFYYDEQGKASDTYPTFEKTVNARNKSLEDHYSSSYMTMHQ